MQSASSRIWTRIAMSIFLVVLDVVGPTTYHSYRMINFLLNIFSSKLIPSQVVPALLGWVDCSTSKVSHLVKPYRLELKNTATASLQGYKKPHTKITSLEMMLNYLILIPKSWNFGECRVPLHCYRSQFHSDQKW